MDKLLDTILRWTERNPVLAFALVAMTLLTSYYLLRDREVTGGWYFKAKLP